MCKIIFNNENHTYTRQSDGMRYMSVSHFYGLFSGKYNGLHHAKKKAAAKCLGTKKFDELKALWHADKTRHILMPEFIAYVEEYIPHFPTYERLVPEILQAWSDNGKNAAGKGTEYHDWREQAAFLRGYEVNTADGKEYPTRLHGKKEDGSNENIVCSLGELEWGFYPELMIWFDFPEPVWSESLEMWICGVCGQEDRVFITESGLVDTSDYKTNKDKKLDTFGIRYTNFGFEYHTGPFAGRKVTKVSKYSIQLNTYSWMLQQHGFTVRHIHILHKEDIIKVYYEPDKIAHSMSMVFNMSL